MPVSLSEWRVRIGTYFPRMPLIQYHNLVRYLTQMRLFLALLNTLADGESSVDPSEQEMSPKVPTDHQSTTDKTSSKPEKDDSLCGLSSDEPKAPTANTDNTKSTPLKEPKKRKRHNNRKGSCGHSQSSGAFLSFRCFLKSGASPLLRFLLLVFTAILLVRSGDVEVNPGPNESLSSGVSNITLIDIAEAIANDMKILRLGFYLQAPEAFIQRCFATSGMSGSVTSKGTHQMLVEWRERTEIQYQRADLREALIQSHLRDVADRYLPGDPQSREETSSEVQNVPIHHAPDGRQSTFLRRPDMASSTPFHPVNPNQEAFADSTPMHSQSSHMYAASSTNYSPGHFGYHGGFHSNPHQSMTSMPAIPEAYATPGSFTPSCQLEPHAWQSQGQRITSIQPIDPSSSSSCRQLHPHVMASPRSSTQTGAVALPAEGCLSRDPMPSSQLQLPNTCQSPAQVRLTISNNNPLTGHQLASTGGASSQSYAHSGVLHVPMMTQQEMVQNNFPPINEQGFISASDLPQESSGLHVNVSRIPLHNASSLEETPSSGMRLPPPHPHISAGASKSRTQSGMLDTVPQTFLVDQDLPGMSTYQTPQKPSVVHPVDLSLHICTDAYVVSRANPSLGPSHNKRTFPGTYIETNHNMDTTTSSREPFTMPSTSGHTSTFTLENSSAPSTDCINPITEEQLEKCIDDIRTSYRVNLCQVPTSPLDSDSIVELQCIFTNLYLLKEDRNKKKQIPLKYEDLLTVDINGEPAKRIMIQGEAGVGKTTFCAKIAWDWVTGERYKEYTLVAVVPLREAKNGRTVGQVLKSYLSDDNDVTSEQLDEYIRTNQDKVLTVFDGFDEFGVEMANEGNHIVQILKGEKHISGRVIVTTRPWRAHKIANAMSLKRQYAFVKIEGFKRKDVKTYVSKFYHDDKTSAQSLLEFMEEGSLITETMAPFPIFCSMLCHMWKVEERREVIRKLQTFSQVFQEMIALLKEHYASKQTAEFDNDSIKEMEKKIDDHFKNISKIAFDGLLNNQLSFQEQVFESCVCDLHVACEVGLLTKEKTMSKKAHGAVRKMARLESTVSFPHKLFQEYTAGVYLHYLYSWNNTEFDRLMDNCIMPKSREFEYLLYFAGSFDEDICKDILQRLIKEKVDLDLIVEVAFEGHSEEAAQLIQEILQQKVCRSLTIKKGSSLHVIAGYMFTIKNLESLCIERIPQTKILSRNLAEKVCSLQTLKELKLVGCNVPVSFSENLLQHAKDVLVETFILDKVTVTKNSAINLAKYICLLPHLKKFQLSTSGSGEDFCAALYSQTSTSKVESLDLTVHGISEHGLQSLGACICSMPCLRSVRVRSQAYCRERGELKATLLKDVYMGESSSSSEVITSTCLIDIKLEVDLLIAFVSLLAASQTSKVENLELNHHDDINGVSESASQNLGASICAMPCLKNVKLSMKLSHGFYIALREGASSLKVENLELNHHDDINGVSESASQNLGASICAMPCLKNVKLSMKLSHGFYIALREGASSLKVETLELNHDDDINGVSESASQNLGATICAMPCLTNVKLSMELSDGFYIAFREGASSLKVETLELNHDDDINGVSESASQNLVATICAMPCLTNVKLSMELSDGFYIAFREGASSLKVESLDLEVDDISEHGLQSLGACICSMPCLRSVRVRSQAYYRERGELKATLLKDVYMGESSSSSEVITSTCLIDIKLEVDLLIAFVSLLAASQTSKVESLDLKVDDISEHGLQSLGACICSMPCLRSVRVHSHSYTYYRDRGELKATLLKDVHMGESSSSSEVITSTCPIDIQLKVDLLIAFVSLLAASQTSKVETLELNDHDDMNGVSESASQNLGASICAMPCLKNVKLSMELSHGFYIALREGASSLKVESLELHGIKGAASQYLGTSICAMPCLKNVKLSGNLSDEFFTPLRESASSLKVESLELHGIKEAASQYLGASVCAMPCLKNVKLSGNLSDEFFTPLRERASSLKISQLHLMGATLNSSHLSTIALMTKLTSLTLFEVRINDKRKLYEEEEGRGLDHTLSSTSLTELNVDHDSFLSLCGIGLLERFPHIQKLTLAFHGNQPPFPQQLFHHVSMPTVTDLSLYGYYSSGHGELATLSLEPFPNLINISLINIDIGTANCMNILESPRRKETLKTISIKDCGTDAMLDSLCKDINSEGKITVTVEHGEYNLHLDLDDLFEIL